MSYREITFQTIAAAVLRRWKVVVSIFLIFLAVGAGAGFLFADRASAEGSGSAEGWPLVDFEPVIRDLHYYDNFLDALNERSTDLFIYVNTVKLDTTMTDDQQQSLLGLCEEIMEYQEEVLATISKELSNTDICYLPIELRQEGIEEYTHLRDITRNQMVKSENAIGLLQSIGGLTSTDENINATYAALLSQAAQYGQLQLDLEHYETMLEMLDNNYTQVRADSLRMESQLEEAESELDRLGQECCQMVWEIALENHLDITASTSGEELSVTIGHTNRPATRQEAFTAFVIFFGLVGMCAGGFFVLCRETSSRKKESLQQ